MDIQYIYMLLSTRQVFSYPLLPSLISWLRPRFLAPFAHRPTPTCSLTLILLHGLDL